MNCVADILWTRLRHIPSGALFSLTPNGSLSEVKLNTTIGIDLPDQPKCVEVIRTTNSISSGSKLIDSSSISAIMLMRNTKQVDLISLKRVVRNGRLYFILIVLSKPFLDLLAPY